MPDGQCCPLQPFDHLLTRCKVANFGWPLPNHKLIKVNEFLLRAGLPGAPYYVILVTLPRMNLSNARCLTRVDLLLGLFSRLYQQFRKSISLLNNQTPRYRKLTHTFILFKSSRAFAFLIFLIFLAKRKTNVFDGFFQTKITVKKHISFASTETAAKLFEYFLTIYFKSEINEEVYIDPTFSYNANYIFILNTGHMLNIKIWTEFQGVSWF